MKLTLFLAVSCAAVALISSEVCRNEKDCNHVTCDNATKLGCSHGECTCLTSAGSCAQATCNARTDCNSCRCRDQRETHHCYDGHCLCGRGFLTGIGK